MYMESTFFEIIKSGGSLGAIALMIFYMVKKDRMQQQKDEMSDQTLRTHFEQHDRVIEKNTEAFLKIAEVIRGCPNNKLNR